jgi:phage terminase Nu1 subunit (DNA packaging protein)
MRKITASLAECAHVLSLTPKAMREAVERGCPCESRPGKGGSAAVFDLRKVVSWRVAELAARHNKDGNGLSTARERLLKAQAHAKERTNEVADGTLIDAGLVTRAYADLALMMRNRLLSLPTVLSPEVAAESDPCVCAAIMRREIEHALEAISSFDPRELPALKRLAASRRG